MDTLFSHVSVLTMDSRMSVWPDAFVGVTDGKISWLAKKAPDEQPGQIIDGSGMVLLPGLTNCHTNLPLTILRGYGAEKPYAEWLRDYVYPCAERMDTRAAKASALLGMAECLRFGVTSISDLSAFPAAVAEAAAQCGMKASVAPEMTMLLGDEFDFETYPECKSLAALCDTWNGFENGRIRVDAGIQGEYTSSEELWLPLAEYAMTNGLGMQLHLSETAQEQADCEERSGLTPAQLLDCYHLFDVRAAAAGCAHLTQEDARLLAKRHVSAVCCPVHDLALGLETADAAALVKAGMNVCLGTGAAAAGGTLDLLGVMRELALSSRARGSAIPAQAALMMATLCGARAQGREAECGQIRVGLDADLVLVNFNQPHLIPCHDIPADLVYAASGRDVALTMVRGKILYADGKFPTIDLGEVMQELHDHAIGKVFSADDQEVR